MTAAWDETSKTADGWDSVSAPLTDLKGIKIPEEDPAETERKRVEARKLAEQREEERRAEAARQEAIRIAEKKAADKKLREERREKRNAVRLRTLQRGFLIDQFTDTADRIFRGVRPVALTAIAACAVILAAGVTWKILAVDFNNHSRPVIVQPTDGNKPDGSRPDPEKPDVSKPDRGDPDAGTGPDRKKPGVAPDGDGTPDDPNGIWGWNKYFKGNKKVEPAS